MAVAWIQWNDQRRPLSLSSDPVGINIPQDEPDEHDPYSLSLHDEEESIDEDKPLYSPVEKDVLSRHSSVGNSWGVTSVGRGFDWRKKREQNEDNKASDSPEISPAPSNDKPVLSTTTPAEHNSTIDLSDSTDSHSTGTQAADSGLPNSLNLASSPIEVLSPTNQQGVPSPTLPSSSHDPSSFEMSQQTSPFTPSLSPSPASPFAVLASAAGGDECASPRPVLAGRSQSMYIIPNAVSNHDDRSPHRSSANASPAIQAQRLRAWSRPVSPVRSPSMPTLITSPSAPSLKGYHAFSPMTPLLMTGGALTTPNTPRSPRLNRSRASQKRVSLVAGRQVTGLNLVGTETEVDPDAIQEWVMFGGGRRRDSPTDDSDPMSASPVDDDDDGPKRDYFEDYRSTTASRRSSYSRSHARSRPSTPPPPATAEAEADWHIGRAGQIKSLGRFGSSLDGIQGPPTPLRCANGDTSEVPSILANGSALPSSKSLVSLVGSTMGDVQIPVEEEAPVYPSLDIPHPDWSLQRLSSSWSLSSSSHQHNHTLTSASLRTRDSTPGRSTSADRVQDDIIMAMRRMKSSASIKRMSSESGRRGGFLGGRTIDDYVILGEAGRGAYGLVKRARERKVPVVGINDAGEEVVLEDAKPDETVGPPLIIKQIIKQRILADCWKKHPIHGTIPIEIYVMSALSGTSYVLPKPRAWDPKRFEDEQDTLSINARSDDESSATVTPGASTPTHTLLSDVKITVTSMTPVEPTPSIEPPVEEVTELDLWRWREGELIKGHPNICPLEDFFEDASFYYLVLPATKPSFPKMPKGMEDATAIGDRRTPSDLFDLVELYPSGLPGPLVRSYLGQIADALSFLHARGICHRDIKDENVVLGENGRCWLIDFGSSGVIRKKGWDSFSGTLDYAAPEILHGERYAGPPQDVWAFGIVAYVLLVGECPFASSAESALGLEDPEGKPAMGLRARCSGGPAGFDEGLERDGGGRLGDAMELVRRCLELDVALRPTMEQVLTCRYLNGGQGWGQELAPQDSLPVAPAA